VRSILGNKSTSQHGTRPPAAVELTPEGVLAGAISGKNQPPVYAFEPLRAGALFPGIADPNIRAQEAVIQAIRSALDSVSPRTRSVTLVVPDTAVRVFVLDFDSLPARPSETASVLRFRMRKMVPFDVEHAGLSYQVLSESKTETRVLAAILPNSILEEYESAVRAAGYEPGAVMPFTLAALAALDSTEPVLTTCLSRLAMTTAITTGNDLLLYRTLDLPESPRERLAEIQRGVAVASAYYEDKLAVRPRQIYFSGNGEPAEFALWIGDPEVTVVDLAPRPGTGAVTKLGHANFAGITGALAGAA
jgi:type IV pilus assembly protein PilM